MTETVRVKFDATAIERPHRRLLNYYFLVSLCAGPAFPIAFAPLFFKYHTMRYRFDEDGVSMSWGILFRREVYLTYRRIQDIHLTRNLVQRWLGLATVAVQTASGGASPEMSIEGVLESEALRDYLYAQMRGARDDDHHPAGDAAAGGSDESEAVVLLREIRDGIRNLTAARSSQP